MMEPIELQTSNIVYKGNGKDIKDLPAERHDGIIVISFQLNQEERDILAVDGIVQVHIQSDRVYPIMVTATPVNRFG